MFRAARPFLFAYLVVGFATTLVTEVVSALQGSSTVLGAFSSGSAQTLVTAVVKYWMVPIVTWPINIFGWALREISARG